MKTLLTLAGLVLWTLPAAAREEQVRDQGAVRSHVWTSAARLENARNGLRAVTAMINDATAWDSTQARELLRDARQEVDAVRNHQRQLKAFAAGKQEAAQDLSRLESSLGGARTLIDKLQAPVAKGVGPDGNDTRNDNTMLGGAAADRGLPPGKGGDVTQAANRGQRGGTPEMQEMRTNLKAAWDKLEDARKDLNKVAGDLQASTKLPEP